MSNRLAGAKSPYLKQHAHNPVNWHPWDDQALALARETDRPIFLSIGYSACHWCHVMERESFESESIAALLHENFISIKVDREERPDLDEVYMTAVQLMTGSGGWPMSVFLTPDGRPFYAGTYFPHDRFAGILTQLGQAWRERRGEIEQVADQVTDELQKSAQQRPLPVENAPTPEVLLASAVEDLLGRFDALHGGFGSAPKFPPHHALRLLNLSVARQIHSDAAKNLLTVTLEKMACGGIYDHIGGGFHRYSTDRIWLVPHFEKMLYDQALLVRAYAEAGVLLDNPGFQRVARETCDWVLRDLTSEQGAFFSALDADSEGEEGKFYIWSRAEAEALAGAEFCTRWQIHSQGNWHDEATRQPLTTNIPHLSGELLDELGPEELASRQALRDARAARPWPLLDDKVLTAWNGLMIGALAFAGSALSEPCYIDAARRAAEFCLSALKPHGELLHRWAEGEAGIEAFLDDYAYLADGLLDLFDATGEARWQVEARALLDTLLSRFWDESEAGFFFTSEAHERLIARSKDLLDGALPSPNGVAARTLARLHDPHAARLLDAYAGMLTRAPHGTATLIGAALLAPSSAPVRRAGQGEITLLANALTLKLGETSEAQFTLKIPDGWHVNGPSPTQEYLFATKATLTSDAPAAVGPAVLPVQETCEGTLQIPVGVRVAPDALPGTYFLALTLSLQPCTTDRCLAPTEVSARTELTIKA
jgi:uncharacterized protein